MDYLLFVRISSYIALFLCALAVLAEQATNDTKSKQAMDAYSTEQKLLFATPHLANIDAPATIYYDFKQHGSQTRDLDDEVILTISHVSEDGGRDVEVVFLSGENNRPYANVKGFHSNPLIMFFLQWDVEKMDSDSNITHHYFRHLLRQAFLNNVDSEKIRIDLNGRRVVAHKVFFQPLFSHQGDERYHNLPRKDYEFILSDAVPGGIYSISTLISSDSETAKDAEGDARAIEETVMRFNRVTYLAE